MKYKYLLLLGLIISVGLLSNCQSDKKGKTEQMELTEIDTSQSMQDILFVLPSPNEIIAEIFINEMNINPELANSYKNADKYLDTRSQAINLGVYIADFAYLSYSEENTTELSYLKVIKQLAENVNMFGLVSSEKMDRITSNLSNNDSLNIISQELYYEISENLESSNRLNIFTLVSSGAIIESLYLSVATVDNFEEYVDVIKKMYEQKFVFENFYEYAIMAKEDPYVKQILDQLEILNETFKQVEEVEVVQTVEKNTDKSLNFSGGVEFVVNAESFNKFKSNIISVRNEITEN